MYLGIDVGGTHTDAVALDLSGRGAALAASAKVPTRPDDLLGSIGQALRAILGEVDREGVRQLNVSTTLSTNAIVQGKTADVGVLVSPGPGIDPAEFMLCRDYHTLSGSIDHRGNEVKRLDTDEVRAAIAACRENGIGTFAVVGKFSTRNPLHENAIRQMICAGGEGDACDAAEFVTLGHRLAGRLNFPRRLATAYFNSAVWRLYNDFADAALAGLDELGLGHARVNVLKADGGTMPMGMSRQLPVQSIFSGPAASVMGIVALCDITFDSVILDIGGTTTDIAIFADGAPLVENDGIHIGSHPTLVRALKVLSIGIGGDSALGMMQGEVRVGPNRLGPSMAFGGERPTLTDALNMAEACGIGDMEASRAGIAAFAAEHGWDPAELARAAVDRAAEGIHQATRELLDEINSKPVYTIHELLEGKRIVPSKIYLMGGPAQAMKLPLFQRFQLSTEVPEHAAVANAIGAALTRITHDIELFADTAKHSMVIPSLGHRQNIPADYTLADAERDAVNNLLTHLEGVGARFDPDSVRVNNATAFNMVEGMRTIGKNIRVKCQIKPGVVRVLR